MTTTKPDKPLANVRVVEIGTSVAAPYAGWILGALGADVIKVERPDGGDDARQWGNMFADGTSSTFHYLNAEKRSITVDLKDDGQRIWLQDFCGSKADVVIQNLRPGHVDRYGIGADDLTKANPRLVYCNLWSFGNGGPMQQRPGYDPLMQALSGIMSVTGEVGRPPVRVGPSMIDMGTGMWCVIGILAALNRRQETGQGGVVDASLYETALGWMANAVPTAQATGKSPGRQGTTARGMAPYQAYECSDGYLIVAAPNDRLFERLCGVLEHPEWTADARFATNQDRWENLGELNALMEPILKTRARNDWREMLDAVGVPSAPVRDTLEMMEDPQSRALGIIQRLGAEGPELITMPVSFDGVRPALTRYAPGLGEHTDELKEEDDKTD
ncbi:MAG: CoA transferase [Hyphomicrobiaceae bacterium]|nr:CoA transferase [Hyphomicrobiaceae bacterium]